MADHTYAPFPNPSSPEPVTMHDPYNASDNQSSSRSSSYSIHAVEPLPVNIASQHESPRSPSHAPQFTYSTHHNPDPSMSRSTTLSPPGAGYTNSTWSGGIPTDMAHSLPSVAKDASPLHYASRPVNLPSVNTIFDEQQLFASSEVPGLSSLHAMFHNPQSLEIGLPVSTYELTSQDGSGRSNDNRHSGLALAPLFERSRYAQPRSPLDDLALRSFM